MVSRRIPIEFGEPEETFEIAVSFDESAAPRNKTDHLVHEIALSSERPYRVVRDQVVRFLPVIDPTASKN